ncbi:ALQxL family class IV lanthipeptide [Streptosporangium sp. NPDC049644]
MELDITTLDMLPAPEESGLYPCTMTNYCTDMSREEQD